MKEKVLVFIIIFIICLNIVAAVVSIKFLAEVKRCIERVPAVYEIEKMED